MQQKSKAIKIYGKKQKYFLQYLVTQIMRPLRLPRQSQTSSLSWYWWLLSPRCCRLARQRRGILPAAGHQWQPADQRQPGHHPLPAAPGDPREGRAPQATGVGFARHHLWRLQVRALPKLKGGGVNAQGQMPSSASLYHWILGWVNWSKHQLYRVPGWV